MSEVNVGRYFVAVTLEGSGDAATHDATVRDAFTGRITASVLDRANGRLRSVGMVSAVGEPGNFLITAAPREPGDSFLYWLRIGNEGDLAELRYVPPAVLAGVDESEVIGRGVASPDGQKVTYTVIERLGYSPADPAPPGARVLPFTKVATVMLDTGEVARRVSELPGVIDSLSWDAHSRLLAFTWRSADGNQIRVVDTRVASDWVLDSQLIAPGKGRYGDYTYHVISPDGASVYVTAATPAPQGLFRLRLLALPVTENRALRLLAEWDASTWSGMCIERTGENLLLFSDHYVHRASLSGGELVRLPPFAGPVNRAAW